MKQQAIQKFCSILNELTDEICETLSFYGTAISVTEWELENDYEDTCYNTHITVHDDLSATVNQIKKEGLTEVDCPADPYYPFRTIEDLPEEKIWDLSKYEVSKHLSVIINPFFEGYLEKIHEGINSIQKIGITNSTTIEVLELLKLLYDRGECIYARYMEGIKMDFCECPGVFIDDVKAYMSAYLDSSTIRRFEEFPRRLGVEIVMPKKKGRPPKNKDIDPKIRDYIQRNPGWQKSKSRWKDLAIGIGFNTKAIEQGRALLNYLTKNCKKLLKEITLNNH